MKGAPTQYAQGVSNVVSSFSVIRLKKNDLIYDRIIIILQPAAVNTVSMSFFIKQWMKMFDTHHTLPLASVTHCLMYLPLFIGEGK